jgi:hypothetical protein
MSWREHNETDRDVAKECAALLLVEAAWNVKGIKLSPTLYHVDWALFRNDTLMAWAEFKHRSHDFGKYDSILLGYAKYAKLQSLAKESDCPAYFIAGFSDGGIYWHEVEAGSPTWIRSGGNNRLQNGDIEPCVFIPLREFKRFPNT